MREPELVETVRLTRDKIIVSYSGADLCLTPELTEKLRAYWIARLDRMVRAAFGVP